MIAGFEVTVVVYALGVAATFAITAARGQARSPLLLVSLGVVEASLVLQGGIDGARLATGTSSPELGTHLAYLATSVLLLPVIGGVHRFDERRWASAALAIGCVLVAIVSIRLHQTLGPNLA